MCDGFNDFNDFNAVGDARAHVARERASPPRDPVRPGALRVQLQQRRVLIRWVKWEVLERLEILYGETRYEQIAKSLFEYPKETAKLILKEATKRAEKVKNSQENDGKKLAAGKWVGKAFSAPGNLVGLKPAELDMRELPPQMESFMGAMLRASYCAQMGLVGWCCTPCRELSATRDPDANKSKS
ncbi:unnamed protein product [Vitrella brassicaformis CCMP3155]|uniref:Uncharacterized protein n=1 Tax=Vitrella brassicaformis (strain CCMP3155) TaxID=1169540 RepID=A0A0G4GCW6_VITBC|nr:unnamed protein product [Vitrella brassicaformis CCMP3155]|eukprot:CEM27113.1 unnamed protein product [Vitrella brassicaformis CCMP3155]